MQLGRSLLLPAAVSFLLVPHGLGEMQPTKPGTAVDSVTVLVKNRRVDEITVSYQYQGGGVRRLGRVLPGRDATFRIPWQAAQLKLRVRIIGGGERATNAVTPQPEDLVELWAHGSLNPRSLRIIRATDHLRPPI
jgi:hypothetical protein